MSSKINILPIELQNQISAGEVVERPASVVKELVENSLDAGASAIEVHIEGGGQNRILVQDNGEGISAEELPRAMTRHATSKISSFQDLNQISSFGFRGEALPSIASVSRLEVTSKLPGEVEASKVSVEFGEIVSQEPASLREGTRVEVRDLFVNTPARLKFLKTPSTESKRCQDVVFRMSLAHLDKEFTMYAADKNQFHFEQGQNLIQRLQKFWPEQTTQGLLPVEFELKGYKIHGLVGKPEYAQSRANRILIFANYRAVQDKLIMSALRQGYQGKLLSKEYPQAVLFLEIPSREIDVNVHPAKSEIRFREEKLVFSLVRCAVQRALSDTEPDKGYHFQHPPGSYWNNKHKFPSFSEYDNEFAQSAKEIHFVESQNPQQRNLQEANIAEHQRQYQPEGQTAASPGMEFNPGLLYLGQLFSTYLIVNVQNRNLLLIDQHAAHERVLFNKYRAYETSQNKQKLALARQIQLRPSEQRHLEHLAPLLRKLGYAFDWEGRQDMYVTAVPAYLAPEESKAFIHSVLDQQVQSMDGLWTALACRKALKSGEHISAHEAVQLLQSWMGTKDRDYCPHGRPAAINLGIKDLEAMFKRGR